MKHHFDKMMANIWNRLIIICFSIATLLHGVSHSVTYMSATLTTTDMHIAILKAAVQEMKCAPMSYARSEPVASMLEESQKQCFYSYQYPYLKTTVNITAQLALVDYWWRTSIRPYRITCVIWAHVENS